MIYIYNYLDGLTHSWHDGGGMVILTDRTPQEAWDEYRANLENPPPLETLPEASEIQPDLSVPGIERVYIFPDAGCC